MAEDKKILKKRIFDIIEIGNKQDLPSRVFDWIIVVAISLNLIATLAMTFDELSPYYIVCEVIETITIVLFTAEYILRLWTAQYLFPDKKRYVATIRFIFSFYGLIDLLTFLPFYLPFVVPMGVVAFRMLRVFRIFRLFRINAQYDAFNVITDVLNDKKEQLFSSICLIMIIMVASSLCMYSIEHDAQPEAFANAFSGIWWSVSTLLTVGYGDIYPITVLGKMMAIIIAFAGVGMVAIPTGIISAGFVEYYNRIERNTHPSERE